MIEFDLHAEKQFVTPGDAAVFYKSHRFRPNCSAALAKGAEGQVGGARKNKTMSICFWPTVQTAMSALLLASAPAG
jgi:hypothetical protein